ncbi:MAG TPA: inorganic phosphate transporter [Clostridiales bacterium]|nr:inorganic phosphate transporter [Clostridiales bacterium]
MITAALVVSILLVLGVIFVNGWTDAPNAIATVVSTRCMSPRAAVIMAVVLNTAGAGIMTLVNAEVASTILNMVDFTSGSSGNVANQPLIVLASSLFAIVVWATAAWYFGIPTSESHALIAGITGGAIALGNGLGAIDFSQWNKVLIGLVISLFLVFFSGFVVAKLIMVIFAAMRRATADRFFTGGQIFGAGCMAFMHGAQDGQKFMGVFLLAIFLNTSGGSSVPTTFEIPFWLILACSLVMGLGTSAGGYRIIKAVGMSMVKLEKYQGFAADFAAAGCLLLASLTGVPVSTTHTKTTAIMGVGSARRFSSVNWGVVKDMLMAWVLTFPGCGLISFLMAKLCMMIF